jgi:hypothetical protein
MTAGGITPAEEVSDRLDIQDLLARYCIALDSRDFDLLETCFLPNSFMDYETLQPMPRGYLDFADVCRNLLEHVPVTQHLLGTISIHVNGDAATADSYVQATHVNEQGKASVTGGHYHDDLVRTAYGWRISQRVLRRQWGSGEPPNLAGHGQN